MQEDVDQSVAPVGWPASNDLMRADLAAQGDDGNVVREISHFCYPDPSLPDAIAQNDVQSVFEEKGISVLLLPSDDGGPEWLELVHHGEVASVSFDMITEWILLRLSSLGWVYDGWTCPVVPASGADME